jgi:hypothetical protein
VSVHDENVALRKLRHSQATLLYNLPVLHSKKPWIRKDQGDQIGRIFSYWMIIFFVRFLKISEVAQIYGTTFSQSIRSLFILTKKWIGLHFGRLFHKLIWSPWKRPCFFRKKAFSQIDMT